jgi:hypothetical protein
MRFLQTRRLIAGGLLAAATTVTISAPAQAQQSEVEQLRALERVMNLSHRLCGYEPQSLSERCNR